MKLKKIFEWLGIGATVAPIAALSAVTVDDLAFDGKFVGKPMAAAIVGGVVSAKKARAEAVAPTQTRKIRVYMHYKHDPKIAAEIDAAMAGRSGDANHVRSDDYLEFKL